MRHLYKYPPTHDFHDNCHSYIPQFVTVFIFFGIRKYFHNAPMNCIVRQSTGFIFIAASSSSIVDMIFLHSGKICASPIV